MEEMISLALSFRVRGSNNDFPMGNIKSCALKTESHIMGFLPVVNKTAEWGK